MPSFGKPCYNESKQEHFFGRFPVFHSEDEVANPAHPSSFHCSVYLKLNSRLQSHMVVPNVHPEIQYVKLKKWTSDQQNVISKACIWPT